MSKDVIIIGAGGHGKVIADIVLRSGDNLLGFLDDNPALPPQICGIPLLGGIDAHADYPNACFVIALGNAALRRRVAEQLSHVSWYTAIHPDAVISPLGTAIGDGTVVMANAVVNPCARIGRHCIINTAAVVEHDNRIGDYCHISVGAKLAGTVTVGENVWVGIGAVISNNLSVCDGCMIGAAAAVVRSIKEAGTYAGVPARRIK